MRTIDADALKKQFSEGAYTVKGIREVIDNAPTITPDMAQVLAYESGKANAERPTGEWYYSCQNGWHCSICQQIVKDMPTVMGKANFDYCPNCGAKMDDEGKKERDAYWDEAMNWHDKLDGGRE